LARRKGGNAQVTAGNPGDLSVATFAKRALASSCPETGCPPPGERGRADASRYRRFHEADLDNVHMLPQLAIYWDRSHMHAVEDHLTAVLSLAAA
jgi:hypothetical protein